MGREIKRVPLDFDWPLQKPWVGFVNPYITSIECPHCGGSGYTEMANRFANQWYGMAPFDPATYGATPLSPESPALIALATRAVDRSPDCYRVHRAGRDEAIRTETRRLHGHMAFAWSHNLIQADVDALVAEGRLMDFTHTPRTDEQRRIVREKLAAGGNSWLPEPNGYTPTAAEVNAWSLSGLGHDCINQHICIRARCEREGHEVTCRMCEGHGQAWSSRAAQAFAEAWTATEPPAGEGWQIWETVTEGSPVSPVFASPEGLAVWLCENDESLTKGTTYEEWVAFITGPGWAPSGVMRERADGSGREVVPGVQWVAGLAE